MTIYDLNKLNNQLINALHSFESKIPTSLCWDNLNNQNTVLIIIDMVNGFAKVGNLYSRRIENLIPNISLLMQKSINKSIQVIAFGDCHQRGSLEFDTYPIHCLNGDFESELVDELKKLGNYSFIPKTSTNGFLEKSFQDFLKNNTSITNFIVVGDCTDICIQQFSITLKTYFNMNNIHSRIIVPTNCVNTFDSPEHPGDLMNLCGLLSLSTNGIELYEKF